MLPQRCFLVNVPEHASQPKLRLMGLAVSWKALTMTDYIEITLDDGTALCAIHVPQYMIDRCKASPHGTFMGKLLDCIVHNNNNNMWTAEQISILEDDPHAELVRWFELSLHVSSERGFPMPQITPDDVLEIIQLESQVAMQDLALFFQLDQGTVQDLLEELQMAGQIYQNKQGYYLPL